MIGNWMLLRNGCQNSRDDQGKQTFDIQGHPEEQVHLEGARGADVEGMKIHSIRLPDLVHQQVLLGGEGEMLTIRHDSFDRKSFMPGIMMAIREVIGRKDLVYGLENIID